jgi:hypothetical protein
LSPHESANQLKKRKDLINKALDEFPNIPPEDDSHLARKANLKLLKGYYQMELDWLEWLISELEKMDK